jgi:hypothetical protein
LEPTYFLDDQPLLFQDHLPQIHRKVSSNEQLCYRWGFRNMWLPNSKIISFLVLRECRQS